MTTHTFLDANGQIVEYTVDGLLSNIEQMIVQEIIEGNGLKILTEVENILSAEKAKFEDLASVFTARANALAATNLTTSGIVNTWATMCNAIVVKIN